MDGTGKHRDGPGRWLSLIPCLLIALTGQASELGRNGFSGNPSTNGGATCGVCHTPGAAVPQVGVTGPNLVDAGSINEYTVTITGGPAVTGGVDVSVSDFAGNLAPVDSDLQMIGNELSHNTPKTFASGAIQFRFQWTAPEHNGAVTLHAAGNSTNGQLDLLGDGIGVSSLDVTVHNGIAPPPPEDPPDSGAIDLDLVASGLASPVAVTHAGDERLFVVERAGRIRIVDDAGNVASLPFLDIAARVDDSSGEEGLLGLAFHPDYAANGYFYVYYTRNDAPGPRSRVSRFRVAGDTDAADADSELVILEFAQPFANHNGGDIKFGPDGYLYIASGDGGSGGDPRDLAQNNHELLGKLLRIDVDGVPGAGDGPDCDISGEVSYRIPPSNAYVDGVGGAGCDEIYASGLRNPWRFSFDRETGDLWIGDVGQNSREEIDFVLAGAAGGIDFGWRCYEGNVPFNSSGCDEQYFFPVHEFSHANGDCSVTGGYVYRGLAYPWLRGHYFFTDFCNASIRTLSGAAGNLTPSVVLGPGVVSTPSTFGEDADGELYVASLSGQLYAIRGLRPDLPPTIVDPADQTSVEGDTIALAVEASDPDGDLLTFSASGLPPGLEVDPASGWISGVLPAGSAGTYPVTVGVSDGVNGSDSASFTWIVEPDPAALRHLISGTVTEAGAGLSAVTFTASNGGSCTASDAAGDYACSVPDGWSGAVTPARDGYLFTPAARAYSGVASDLAGENFAGSSAGGLVGHWRLDETAGAAAGDASGNGNAGTVRGGATWSGGQVDGALALDGSSQDVVVADSASLSVVGEGLTLAGWIYPTEAQTGTLIHKNFHFSMLRRASGALTYADSSTWSYRTIGDHGNAPLQVWTHVAVTFDGTAIRFYVNGSLVSTVSRPGSLADNANAVYLGSYAGTAARFPGLLDDMRVYDRALDAAQVSALHGAGAVDTTPPALAAVTPLGANTLEVRFSEPLTAASAESPGNYAVGPGVSVTGATLGGDGRTLTLDTTALLTAVTYTLTVNGVEDLSGNPIAADSEATFEWLPPADGLVGHWRLDETAGAAAGDASGNGNAGTVRGGATWSGGQVDGALALDGSSQDVVVADSTSLSVVGEGLTLAGWIYPTEAQTGTLIHKNFHFSMLRRASGALTYADSATWSYRTIGDHGNAPLQVWTHVAVTFDGTAIRFYVNGSLVSTVSRAGSLADNANALYLGSYAGTAARFPGLLDDMRVYDRALDAAQVSALHGAGAVDTTPPTLAAVTPLGANTLQVHFSEPLTGASAESPGN